MRSGGLNKVDVQSFVWKTAQSVCTLGINFIIQIILARMLLPDDFGILAVSTVFITLANTIIETSFSSAIIQREELNQQFVTSVFYANIGLSLAVYGGLFLVAPQVADFYRESLLVPVLRVQGLRVAVSGFFAIPQALLSRKMQFKKLFFCGLLGVIAQAIVGVWMALSGAGVWAIVISTLVGSVMSGFAMLIIEPWMPTPFFSLYKIRTALSFSAKVLAVRITRKLFYNIRVLAMGRIYGAVTLGYFNKGFQFPSTIMTVIDGSLTTVAFTALSKLQNDKEKLLASLRQYVRVSVFLCMPMMIGLALIARPLVIVLLTEKWLDCVPFLQIVCFTQMLIPLNVKTTAFEAIGKSGISMKLHLTGIFLSVALLLLTSSLGAEVMTLSGLFSSIILQVIITVAADRGLKYEVKEQLRDGSCAIIPTLIMTLAVMAVKQIPCGNLLQLCLEIFSGITVYIAAAAVTKNQTFILIVNIIKKDRPRERNADG